MKLVVRRNAREQEVKVDAVEADASVGSLATSLGLPATAGLLVDGALVTSMATVAQAGVLEGSVLEAVDRDSDDPAGEPLVELHQIGGLAAGGLLRMAPGRYDMGTVGPVRGTLAAGDVDDPLMRLVVSEDGSFTVFADESAGVMVDGTPLIGAVVVTDEVLEVGGVLFRATPAMDRRRVARVRTADGHAVVERVGRPAPVAAPDELPPPPIVPGGQLPQDDRQLASFLAESGRRLARSWRSALTASRAAHPDVAELRARSTVVASSLWERRPTDHDHLMLSAGFGAQRWRPPSMGATLAPELSVLLQSPRELPAVPISVDLRGGSVGVAGPRAAVLAVARWFVVQVASLHGPDDVRIAIGSDAARAADWEWATWLPHLGVPADPVPAVVDCVSVVDVADPARIADPKPGQLLLVLAETLDELPAACSTIVVVLTDGRLIVQDKARARREEGIATGVTEQVARTIARSLAGVRVDANGDRPGAVLAAATGSNGTGGTAGEAPEAPAS